MHWAIYCERWSNAWLITAGLPSELNCQSMIVADGCRGIIRVRQSKEEAHFSATCAAIFVAFGVLITVAAAAAASALKSPPRRGADDARAKAYIFGSMCPTGKSECRFVGFDLGMNFQDDSAAEVSIESIEYGVLGEYTRRSVLRSLAWFWCEDDGVGVPLSKLLAPARDNELTNDAGEDSGEEGDDADDSGRPRNGEWPVILRREG